MSTTTTTRWLGALALLTAVTTARAQDGQDGLAQKVPGSDVPRGPGTYTRDDATLGKISTAVRTATYTRYPEAGGSVTYSVSLDRDHLDRPVYYTQDGGTWVWESARWQRVGELRFYRTVVAVRWLVDRRVDDMQRTLDAPGRATSLSRILARHLVDLRDMHVLLGRLDAGQSLPRDPHLEVVAKAALDTLGEAEVVHARVLEEKAEDRERPATEASADGVRLQRLLATARSHVDAHVAQLQHILGAGLPDDDRRTLTRDLERLRAVQVRLGATPAESPPEADPAHEEALNEALEVLSSASARLFLMTYRQGLQDGHRARLDALAARARAVPTNAAARPVLTRRVALLQAELTQLRRRIAKGDLEPVPAALLEVEGQLAELEREAAR